MNKLKIIRLLFAMAVLTLTSSGAQVSHYVYLHWDPSPTVGVVYSVYRQSPISFGYVRRVANLKTTNWTDNKVSAGTTYSYYVIAVKNTVNADPSNTVTVTVPTP